MKEFSLGLNNPCLLSLIPAVEGWAKGGTQGIPPNLTSLSQRAQQVGLLVPSLQMRNLRLREVAASARPSQGARPQVRPERQGPQAPGLTVYRDSAGGCSGVAVLGGGPGAGAGDGPFRAGRLCEPFISFCKEASQAVRAGDK